MRVGVHLPLADLGTGRPAVADLRAYTVAARDAGFTTVAANDHLVWQRPWLDGMVALAAVAGDAAGMTLATSVALPTVRHPVVLAKALSSLAAITDSPVVAGLGPGSSAADHAAVGVPFEERWGRFDEGFRLVRALLRGESPPAGRHYPLDGLELAPLPETPPAVWFGSWGSDTRLRRLAAVADGWLASAYNTTPDGFVEARARLDAHLRALGRDPATFPAGVATTWTYVTDDARRVDEVVDGLLAPLLGREPATLRPRVAVGPPDHVVALLDAYRRAGASEILLWPLFDPIGQLEVLADRVLPHVTDTGAPGRRGRTDHHSRGDSS